MNVHKFNVKPKSHKMIKWLILRDVKHSAEKINTSRSTWKIFAKKILYYDLTKLNN